MDENSMVRSICWNAYSYYDQNKDKLSKEKIDANLNPLRKKLIDVLEKSKLDNFRLVNLEMKGYKLLMGD